MDQAYETGDLSFVATCCGSTLSMNELEYGWPCGFARFSISARNPNVADFPKRDIEALERLLGTGLRVVWQDI